MEKFEGWDPHPTRKIIYEDLKTGLLYRRRESGSFDMVPLKMTEHQVLEIFRKADGVVAMPLLNNKLARRTKWQQ